MICFIYSLLRQRDDDDESKRQLDETQSCIEARCHDLDIIEYNVCVYQHCFQRRDLLNDVWDTDDDTCLHQCQGLHNIQYDACVMNKCKKKRSWNTPDRLCLKQCRKKGSFAVDYDICLHNCHKNIY